MSFRWFFLMSIVFTGLSCALWERHESIVKKRYINGTMGFEYHAGIHLVHDQMEKTKQPHSKVITLLLEDALREEGLCPEGYKIVNRMSTEHGDPLLIGICLAK